MYRNAYQRGMLTVFFSCGSHPLSIWETRTQDGYITIFLDQDIKSMVLEIGGTNVSTTYMTCPKGNQVLGITMPFLVMIVKNLKKYFSFEVTILDETGTRRRFRVSNFQSTTQILPLCTVMPIGLSDGWNQIQFNLAEFTRRAYKKQFVEVQKLKINANIRLRRIYFTERLIPEDQLPPEYKLFFPLSTKGAKGKKGIEESKDKENINPSTAQQTPGITEEKEVDQEAVKARSKASVYSAKRRSQEKVSKTRIEDITEAPSRATPIEGKAAEGEQKKGEEAKSEAQAEEVADSTRTETTEGESTVPEGTEHSEPGEPAPASEVPTDAPTEEPQGSSAVETPAATEAVE